MKPMETIQDLIEEAKFRTVWWALCIFAVSYFLTHTSKSIWMNVPISILFVSALRILLNEVDVHWKVRSVHLRTYLSHLEKKQLSAKDSRLYSTPAPPKWKRKIDSPIVEAAMSGFIDKILKDFVVDMWYSEITPDREFPDHIHAIIMDTLGEISGRVKELNLVDLLTRDIVDLIGDHLDVFRRNQAAIGVEVMATLSSEERDERLKHHLMASKELHPALISPESEYKVLQQLIGGVLAVVLRPREFHSPLIRSIARELITCLVMQPVMDFATPGYVNELIEHLLLAAKDDSLICEGSNQSTNAAAHTHGHPLTAGGLRDDDSTLREYSFSNQGSEMTLTKIDNQMETFFKYNTEKPMNYQSADWARMPLGTNEIAIKKVRQGLLFDDLLSDERKTGEDFSQEPNRELYFEGGNLVDKLEHTSILAMDANKHRLKRSNSTSALIAQPDTESKLTGECKGLIISEFYGPNFGRHGGMSASDMVLHSKAQQAPKLKCRVMGAYFEKLGSKSFAVYTIGVTDAENKTWFVKRRYRNFERLHRHLKDIPNYMLHLPPKRIFSS